MIDFDELALKLAKAEADNVVLKQALDVAVKALKIAKDCCSDYSIERLAGETLDQIKQITESPTENMQTTYTADGTTMTFFGKKCKVEFDVPPETQTHITITETKE